VDGALLTTARSEVAMPRRWKAFIFLSTLLAATLSFASFASAQTDNVTVLHLTAVEVESHLVDVAPTGGPPTLGDTFVASDNLLQGGRRVGVAGIVCIVVRVQHPPFAFQCQATARIGSDQLTAQGLVFDQPSSVFAITGGTGRWRNAGGQVVSREVSPTRSELTFYISDLG
jgi:hypothetical protein